MCRSTLCQTQTAMISEFLHIMGRHLQDEEPKTAFLTSDADKKKNQGFPFYRVRSSLGLWRGIRARMRWEMI